MTELYAPELLVIIVMVTIATVAVLHVLTLYIGTNILTGPSIRRGTILLSCRGTIVLHAWTKAKYWQSVLPFTFQYTTSPEDKCRKCMENVAACTEV